MPKISELNTTNRRTLLERATGELAHYSTVADLMTAAASGPKVARLLPGTYDFTGITMPAGLTLIGPGMTYDSTASPAFGGGAIIAGRPTAGRANRFRGLVFNDGIIVDNLWCGFQHCGFYGADGIEWDGTGAPYYGLVDDCWFRGQTGNCMLFYGAANSVTVTNSQFQPGLAGHAMYADSIGGTTFPVDINVHACRFEAVRDGLGDPVDIGSYVYGCFRSSTWGNCYLDGNKPTCTDGAEYVFDYMSRDNLVTGFNTNSDTFLVDVSGGAGGYGNRFECQRKWLTTGTDNTDLGTYSGVIPEVVTVSSCANIILPYAHWCYTGSITITCDRAGGTTVTPQSGTINGGASLAMANGEMYRFYLPFLGSATTAWLAKQLV